MTTVIFACVHNAGRSQMAAALFNARADPARAHAISAGTRPGTHVHPEVVEAMNEVGLDLSHARPQRLTAELAAGSQMIITMGCGDECPYVPGIRRDDWPLEDPRGKPISRVREIRDEIRQRVHALIAQERWDTMSGPDGIRAARIGDLPEIERLLAAAGLPLDGVREAFQTGFVAEHNGRIVGAAALECYDDGALLRSVVVEASARGTGVGRRLTATAVERARTLKLPAVYLLTTTAAAFFPRLGFEMTTREAVPPSIRRSIEFQSACPSSANVFTLRLR